ncbi:hypothetical protein RRG08_050759 [Elysia crispata]|uniref:Reverse transcriptase domain-containing protein n=1 Tax=Elysia crispata TaxID=231223 RepID=A0AAE1DKN1_9GAST|nr:hypothetical protein RRG08_050759 [Elysia crispata]
MQTSDDDKPGELGTARLYTSQDAKPKTLPCRKIPFALTQRVKDELETLVKRGILVPIKEPTPWVSQMAIVEKSNGSLRLRIDPRPLNEALQREQFKLPTFDDVLPAFNKAYIFTKQDIKEAFWHIKLDEEFSKLTAMITPYGRFRWTRLPFGLNVSSEIFQRHLTQALEGLEGYINVADDIIVTGRGDTQEKAEKDHEKNIKMLKERCKDKGIKLNPSKASEKQEEVTFMGHSISTKGVQPDTSKIEAILKMPAPQDIHDVRRFCGML